MATLGDYVSIQTNLTELSGRRQQSDYVVNLSRKNNNTAAVMKLACPAVTWGHGTCLAPNTKYCTACGGKDR